ncbi:hypothetical protein GCM10010174_21030 [Kutzneria viridogrisea]
MVRFRFLFQPGWVALTLVVFVFAGSCYAVLAPWQFGRNSDQEAQNSALQNSFSSSAVPLEQLVPAGGEPAGKIEWRLVSLTGGYLPEGEAVARLRTVQGKPASEVLTPFRLRDGRIVLVDRGYQELQPGKEIPDYPAAPGGEVTLVARVRADEPLDSRAPILTASRPQVYQVSAVAVVQTSKLTITPGYFQLEPNQPGVVNALPLPQLDSGPFFSYAVQWIIFGTMALFGWAYFSWREARPGGALDKEVTQRPKRKSVAEILAEDEAREQASTSS